MEGKHFIGTLGYHWFQSRLELVDVMNVMNDIIPQSIFPMKFKVSNIMTHYARS